MRIIETYIVWHERFDQFIKLHKTAEFSDGTGIKWFTEIQSSMSRISFDDALELLNQ
jgi:hypothetical protein